jgi:hypothetical protein
MTREEERRAIDNVVDAIARKEDPRPAPPGTKPKQWK